MLYCYLVSSYEKEMPRNKLSSETYLVLMCKLKKIKLYIQRSARSQGYVLINFYVVNIL